MITLENICKIYDRNCVEALRNVSLAVADGDYLSVTGASGSGKSTLMHILGLLDAPTSGRYLLDGQDVSALTSDERAALRGQAIGFIFQSFRLLQDLSALENVALPLAFQGWTRSALRTVRPTARASFPAGSSSASRLPAPLPPGRASCSPTSRPPGWTPPPAAIPLPCLTASTRTGTPLS